MSLVTVINTFPSVTSLTLMVHAQPQASSCEIQFRQMQVMVEPAGFREHLLEAVDYGLMVLGEIVRQAIYEQIENHHALKREEIPERLETFHIALEDVLGTSARTVERLIVKNLYQRLSLGFVDHPEWTLVDHVNHVRAALEASQPHASSGSLEERPE